MKFNQLGRTGLYVSEICLGTMTFGGTGDGGVWKAMGSIGQDDVDAITRKALDGGVNFFDTADVYQLGAAEERLGQSLRNLGVKRSDVVVASKVNGPVGPGPNDRGASRGHILDSVKASLKRLQMDHIDLYQIHGNDDVAPVEETLRALDDLVSQGLVRYVGVSNWQAWKIAKALGLSAAKGYARIETLQAYYTIAGRDIERELVPMLTAEQVGLMVWSPLAGGLLSGKFGPGASNPEDSRRTTVDFPPVDKDRAWKCIEVMRDVGAAHGISVARVALAWLLHKRHVMSVVIGAKTVAQVEDNLAAADVQLSAEEMKRLDEVSQMPPEYPNWMIAIQGAGRVPGPFKPAV